MCIGLFLMRKTSYLEDTMKSDKSCGRCSGGVYVSTGIALLSDPPKYPVKCNVCSHEIVTSQFACVNNAQKADKRVEPDVHLANLLHSISKEEIVALKGIYLMSALEEVARCLRKEVGINEAGKFLKKLASGNESAEYPGSEI